MFKSGKNGFAITQQEPYCRDMGDADTTLTNWDDLAHCKRLKLDGCHIRHEDKLVCYFADNSDMMDRFTICTKSCAATHARLQVSDGSS